MLVTAVQDRLALSVAECKRLLRLDLDDATDDDLIRLAIAAGKVAADAYCNNPFLERVDLDFDDNVNWSGNRVGAFSPNPFVNSNQSSTGRLSHTLPDRYSDPPVELPIPDLVKLGVVKFVEFALDTPAPGVSEESVGDWSKKFSVFVSNPDQLSFVQNTYWSKFRLVPGF